MRWLKELFNPSAKCGRVGHREVRQSQNVMRKTTWEERRMGVCMRVTEERTVCGRCEATLQEPKETKARGVDSWSAPQSVWDEFESTGRYVSRNWRHVTD